MCLTLFSWKDSVCFIITSRKQFRTLFTLYLLRVFLFTLSLCSQLMSKLLISLGKQEAPTFPILVPFLFWLPSCCPYPFLFPGSHFLSLAGNIISQLKHLLNQPSFNSHHPPSPFSFFSISALHGKIISASYLHLLSSGSLSLTSPTIPLKLLLSRSITTSILPNPVLLSLFYLISAAVDIISPSFIKLCLLAFEALYHFFSFFNLYSSRPPVLNFGCWRAQSCVLIPFQTSVIQSTFLKKEKSLTAQ